VKIESKKVLITGGAGFIGSHIVDSLVKNGAEVIVLDNFSSGRLENIANQKENIKIVRGSVLNLNLLKKIIKDVDVVSHQAASLEIFRALDDPFYDLKTNVIGTLNVLKACLDSNVKKIINASSACVYGQAVTTPQSEDHPLNPHWPYGVSKLAAEKYCTMFHEFYGLPTVSLRYAIVYGPREWFGRVLTIFIKRVTEGKPPVIFGNGKQVRDFIHVFDVVRVHNICIEKSITNGKVYNIGSGVGTTIEELANAVIQCANKKLKPIYEEVKEGEESKYVRGRKRIPGELKKMHLDISKTKKELDWKPQITIEEGVKTEIEWYIKNLHRWQVKEIRI